MTYYKGDTTGNVDTDAITGSDANVTLKVGATDYYGTALTAEDLQRLANELGNKAALTGTGDDTTLVIGTGTEKIDRTVVPETLVNTYTATTTSSAQKINTGSRNWVVQATDHNDSITAGGADSINAGAGNDEINVNGDGAIVTTGEGTNKIAISADVKNITLTDLNAEDEMTITGTFEVGAAKIEDMLLVITDKTGTRKIKLGDFTNATNAKVNIDDTSTTIGQWLTDNGIDLNNLISANNTNYSNQWLSSNTTANTTDDGDRIAPDPGYTPTPKQETPAQIEMPVKLRSMGTLQTSANTAEEPPTVNLDNFTNLNEGANVEVDGQTVGNVSSTFPEGTNTFTRNGLTIHLLGRSTTSSSANITALTYDGINDSEKAIVAGLFKWWAADCLNLDEETYGISFKSDAAMVKEIGLYFYTNESSNTLAAVGNSQRISSDGVCTMLTLNVNMKYYGTVVADDMKGEGTYNGNSAGFLDRTLAYEFVHALMASNVNYFQKLPQFISEGTAELAHGIDDERSQNIFNLATDSTMLANTIEDLTPGTGNNNSYAGGFMFLRYFAKQATL